MTSKLFPGRSWNSKSCLPSWKPSCLSLFSPEADSEIRIVTQAAYLASGPRTTRRGMGSTTGKGKREHSWHHRAGNLSGQLRLSSAAQV